MGVAAYNYLRTSMEVVFHFRGSHPASMERASFRGSWQLLLGKLHTTLLWLGVLIDGRRFLPRAAVYNTR